MADNKKNNRVEDAIEELLLDAVNLDLDEAAVQRLENKVTTIRNLNKTGE